MTSAPAPATAEETALGFVAALRGAGVAVPVTAAVSYLRALAELGGSLDELYWAGRATLLTGPEQTATHDAVFARWWLGGEAGPDRDEPVVPTTLVTDDEDDGGDGTPPPAADDAGAVQALRFSAHEVLRAKDFADYDEAELAEARRLMADLRLLGAARRSRRLRPSRRPRGHPDLRRTVGAALRTGGEPLQRRTLERRTRPRRIVVLLDVSGSMETYSRALLRFAHAAVSGRTRVEVFTLGTRLTRLTRELTTRDPDAALTRAAAAVPDWSGGTRLGEGLQAFNDAWGVRGMARGATVVILSDGWDRGDPAELAEQMARLSRVAHRVVWVNPLKASPEYAPLAQGMAAALPFVDDFVEGHSVDALEELARVIAR
ncbi:vWA domain-containing protein [Rhabdothermincola salaria]|uniref:vWA domain-containing protein n=1 Tax=Rhabdothermincola salaria TaxID=2903142 RepID=UPI001E56C263|nr:VWA domain-containing protein [Rhabdothermincola salaria]MCD9623480.1 VWA domain-containing protein [Rhabdothermincola salaria]